jgi:hypothetical protein
MENAFDLNPLTEVVAEPIPMPEIPSPASIATSVVSGIAATAASAVVMNLIYDNTDTDEYRLRDHAKLYIGSYVIGMMVADRARKHIGRKVKPTMVALENWLWIPVEEETPVKNFPQTPEFVALVNAIPKKQ